MHFICQNYKLRLIAVILFSMTAHVCYSQSDYINFRHLTTNGGLSDGSVRCIAQDKYGFIWFGTYNGLNRYNSYSVQVFQHSSSNPKSIPENNITELLSDSKGRLWVCLSQGVYQYDFATSNFILLPGTEKLNAIKMVSSSNGDTYIRFKTCIGKIDGTNGKFSVSLNIIANDLCIASPGLIYYTTDNGLFLFDFFSNTGQKIEIKGIDNTRFNKISLDQSQNLWIGCAFPLLKLHKINLNNLSFVTYSDFNISSQYLTDNTFNCIFSDRNNKTWIGLTRAGMSCYDSATGTFINYHNDPLQRMSMGPGVLNTIFQDKNDMMWIGSEGYGVSYFNSKKNLFRAILPAYNQKPTLPDLWTRAASQDAAKNIWIATINGVAKWDPKNNQYTILKNDEAHPNVLYANSVRSILCDKNFVWIGTNAGLNRYNQVTGKMDFFTEKRVFPRAFFGI